MATPDPPRSSRKPPLPVSRPPRHRQRRDRMAQASRAHPGATRRPGRCGSNAPSVASRPGDGPVSLENVLRSSAPSAGRPVLARARSVRVRRRPAALGGAAATARPAAPAGRSRRWLSERRGTGSRSAVATSSPGDSGRTAARHRVTDLQLRQRLHRFPGRLRARPASRSCSVSSRRRRAGRSSGRSPTVARSLGAPLVGRAERRAGKPAGDAPRSFGEMDYLLGVRDDLRQGAFASASRPRRLRRRRGRRDPVPLELPRLLSAADHLERDQASDDELRTLLRGGSSLGGARPKAHVLDAAHRSRSPSFRARPTTSGTSCAGNTWRCELARAGGIRVSDSALHDIDGKPVLSSIALTAIRGNASAT